MYQKHETGVIGEDLAVKYLIQNGYKIWKRNFKCKQGEIDIIAWDNNELVIIEVKTRTRIKYGKPVDAVNIDKRRHIFKVTEYFVFINKLENEYIRFDVIEVYIKDNKYYINHIKNIM